MLEWACECDHRSRGSSNKAKTEKCSTIVSLLTIATPMIRKFMCLSKTNPLFFLGLVRCLKASRATRLITVCRLVYPKRQYTKDLSSLQFNQFSMASTRLCLHMDRRAQEKPLRCRVT